MADRLANPFAFEPGRSSLARLHPLAKLAFLLAATTAVMQTRPAVMAALFALGLILSIRIPRAAGGPLRAIALLAVFAGLIRGIFPGDGRLFDISTLPDSVLYATRLFSVYLFSRIFYATTRVSEIGDWLTAAARLIQAAWRRIASRRHATLAAPSILSDPGMLFSIVLLFLPRIFDAYTRIREAGEVRGITLSRRNVGRSLAMLEHLIVESMMIAYRTSLAMRVRGYSPERSLRLSALSGWDWALMTASAGLLFLR